MYQVKCASRGDAEDTNGKDYATAEVLRSLNTEKRKETEEVATLEP